MRWLEQYTEKILSGELTFEDVRNLRENKTGKKPSMVTIRRLWNRLGYSTKDCGCISGMHEGEAKLTVGSNCLEMHEGEAKLVVCSNCADYYQGCCNTKRKTFKGWQDGLEGGYCPFKRMI